MCRAKRDRNAEKVVDRELVRPSNQAEERDEAIGAWLTEV